MYQSLFVSSILELDIHNNVTSKGISEIKFSQDII